MKKESSSRERVNDPLARSLEHGEEAGWRYTYLEVARNLPLEVVTIFFSFINSRGSTAYTSSALIESVDSILTLPGSEEHCQTNAKLA